MAKLDAQFFKPFVDGTLHTLRTACHTDPKPGKPFIKGSQPQPTFAIAGVIGLVSEKFTGTITICFPENVFLSLMSKMLGESFSEVTQELQDGAAELMNMIFGQAKIVLNDQGHAIQKAIPTVLRGKSIQTSAASKTSVVVLPFLTPEGEFQIEICAE